jgi:hypothetical protein
LPQTVHSVLGFESTSAVPIVQFVQDMEPGAAYEPLKHDAHGVDGSESTSAVPDTQMLHAAVPCKAW